MSKRSPLDLRHMGMPQNLAWHRTQATAAKWATANGYRHCDVMYVWFRFHSVWCVGQNIAPGTLRFFTKDLTWVDVEWAPDLYTRIGS